MSDEVTEANSELARLIANASDTDFTESPEELRWPARHLLGAMYTDPQWSTVQAVLQEIADENTVDAILDRQHAAMRGIFNSLYRFNRTVSGVQEAGPSQKEMQEAQADLQNHLPEIVRQLPKVEATAEKLTADPAARGAIELISKIVKEGASSKKLTPIALLVVLWWVLGVTSPNEIAALAVWYAVARDVFKKD